MSAPASSTTPSTSPSPIARYLTLWGGQLASVLGQMSGKTLQAALLAPSGLTIPESALPAIILQHSGGRDGKFAGRLAMHLSEADAVLLACQFTGEDPGDASTRALTDDSREALLELFRQAGGLIGTAIKAEFGEVKLDVSLESSPPSAGEGVSALTLADGDTMLATLIALGDDSLAASLIPATVVAEAIPSAATAASANPNPANANPANANPANANRTAANLDLLWDVHLGVVLRFGRRRMPLREILDFCAGTVIELDQQIEDPVELLLDGKVIAKGEVVVVEGNYGLRVTAVTAATAVAS